MTLYRVVWYEPIIREMSDGRVVWLVQECERFALTVEGADQIMMDLDPVRIAIMLSRFGEMSPWVAFVAGWNDRAKLEMWEEPSDVIKSRRDLTSPLFGRIEWGDRFWQCPRCGDYAWTHAANRCPDCGCGNGMVLQ